MPAHGPGKGRRDDKNIPYIPYYPPEEDGG